jgi:uncharacterized protein
MTDPSDTSYTAFKGHRRIASGSLQSVAVVVKQVIERSPSAAVLIFDDVTGRSVEIDTRGTVRAMMARLARRAAADERARLGESGEHLQSVPDSNVRAGGPRGRGRPKLGVIAREVTLLPRHWEWLATQPGGASVALRKLVEEARRTHAEQDRRRKAQERAFHFMSAMAGDMPGFEDAIRALFANDQLRMSELISAWPKDVRNHAIALAFDETHPHSPATR